MLFKTLEHTNPKRIKEPFPVPRQPLISRDGNQATNSTMIIIHVVNHLFFTEKLFSLLSRPAQFPNINGVNSRGWEYQCRESRMVNTIFCIFLFFYLSIDFFFLYKINWEMDSDLTANRTILHSYCTVIFCDTESL